MSFWSAIGDFFAGNGGNHEAVPDAFNQAQVKVAAGPTMGRFGINFTGADPSLAVFAPVHQAISALSYVPNQALHGLATGWNVGDVANAHGESQWHPFVSLQDWKNAWNVTSATGEGGRPSFGGSVYHALVNHDLLMAPAGKPIGGMFGTSAGSIADRQQYAQEQNTWTGRIGSGAIDLTASWYADPTIIGGKVAKATRAASRLADAQDTEAAVAAATRINQGETKAESRWSPTRLIPGQRTGLFSKGMEESGQRLFQFVKGFDNETSASALASSSMKPVLERTSDPAPILGLFAQAGKIGDLDLQRQVKIDVLGAAGGSQAARERLVENSPAIARAQMRVSNAPEEFAGLDDLANNYPQLAERGRSLTQAAIAMSTPENESELAAYGRALDRLHQRFEDLDNLAVSSPIEQAGATALDRAKGAIRQRAVRDFYYQDGLSGRTVRVLHWATAQRSRGTISIDHTFRGNDELIDHVKRTGLFDGAEIQQISDGFLSAGTQELRRRVVDRVWDAMYAKLGARYDLTPEEVIDMARQSQDVRSAGRQYASTALEQARALQQERVVLNDPATGTATSVRAAALETQLANTAVLPDTQLIERAIRAHQQGKTLSDEMGELARGFTTVLDHANDVWRLAVLARPGLLVRTQLDTQARSLAVMGGTRYLASAVRALGHSFNKVLSRDELIQVGAKADDLAHADEVASQARELRRQAAQLSGEPGDRLISRAEELEAQAESLRTTTYTADRTRLGQQDQSLNGAGEKVTTRAIGSAQEGKDLNAALLPGNAHLSDLLLRGSGRQTVRIYEDADSWTSAAPTDPYWAEKWIRATDQVRNSHTARRVMQEADHQTADLIAGLRKDKEARAEWRNLRGDNEDFDEWLDRVVDFVAWHAPTRDIRQSLLTAGRPTPDDAIAMFARPGEEDSLLPARMDVHGPQMSVLASRQQAGNIAYRAARKIIATFGDKPDVVMGRHPLYVNRYGHHFREMAEREIGREGKLSHEAQAKIERIAKHRAIQDVHRTMYDTARHTGAHATMRFITPFLAAWQDAMESWSRLMYDDPRRIGAFAKLWNAPERMGLVVDQDGNKIEPGHTAEQKFVLLPTSFSNHFDTAKTFELRKDSLNSIFQGSVPYLPGFGPSVQVPASEIFGRMIPELGDSSNPLIRSLFPAGMPKRKGLVDDVAASWTPAYIQHLYEAFQPQSTDYTNAFADSVNSQIISARQAGKPLPSEEKMIAVAAKQARNNTLLRGAVLGVVGFSGQESNVADFYRRQYQLFQANAQQYQAQGTSVDQAFAAAFPEAAGLTFSVTKNETGVQATVKAEDRARKFRSQIAANPEYGWFYVGSDNLGGQFSQSVYNAQYSTPVGGGGTLNQRHSIAPRELADRAMAEDGWAQYQKIKMAVDLKLKQWGMTSLNQNGAANLKAAQDTAIAQLRRDNPSWAKDFDNQDSGKLQRFLDTVATPALSDPKLKNRSDIQLLGQYLELRKQALAKLQSWGYKSLTAQAAAPLKAILYQAGQDYANQNLGFQQMWQRMLSREVG